jgi:hypothetical protein
MNPVDYYAAAQERRQRDKMLRDAAPDMLAALHEVLNLCDRDSEIGWVCVAAIAKAKGN